MQSRINTFQEKLAENENAYTSINGPSFQEMTKRAQSKKQKIMEAKLYQDQ